MENVRFDPTINLGAIIQIITLFVFFIGVYIKFNNYIQNISFKVNLIWAWWVKEHNIAVDSSMMPRDKL